jgi:hypothetical protein
VGFGVGEYLGHQEEEITRPAKAGTIIRRGWRRRRRSCGLFPADERVGDLTSGGDFDDAGCLWGFGFFEDAADHCKALA